MRARRPRLHSIIPRIVSTERDRLEELLQARAQAEEELEKLRTPMTILFSDIKGSTAYAEKRGDVEYMAMISRHNSILFPVIEGEGGRVVKTIGDAILACFQDPVAAIKAGVGMQRVLVEDRKGRQEIDQIHIRVGLHTGFGLIKDGDVFGDVVNAASRVQHQADVEQVLITDVLLEAVSIAGFECAKMSRTQLKGKDQPIDLYAVAWSESATQQLIEQVQAQYEKKLKDARKRQEQLEEQFDAARDQWRTERRNLNSELEQLEEAVERARQNAKVQASEDLQAEIRFQLEEAIRSRRQSEEDLIAARKKFDAERRNLKAQIASMQASAVDAMERSNNPARLAMAVSEKLEARLAEAKQEWQLQWDGERRRLTAEIERLKKTASPAAAFEKKEAARRAVLEKLGKLPPGSAGPSAAARTADQWQREFEDAKIGWENERNQLNLKIKKLEMEGQRAQDMMRSEVFQEMRAQYEPRLVGLNNERQRLEQEIQSLTNDLDAERERLNARIAQLEREIPEAQEVARKQTLAELQSQFDTKVEEANRQRSRLERKQQDEADEREAELRRAKKQIASLEEQLKEANERAYKAQKAGPRN
jgi:adenylate cyclase